MLNGTIARLRALVMRRRLEREMQEEMAQHLERSVERLVTRGLSPEQARHAARREFGNVMSLQEEGRAARGWRWISELTEDLRFALRHFRRRPAMTLTIVGVLAIGMSVSTGLFSLLHAYSTQPPPGIPAANDLVRIRGTQRPNYGGLIARGFSERELHAYEEMTSAFRAVAGWTDQEGNFARPRDDDAASVAGVVTFVNASYFSVLGVRPLLGSTLPAAAFESGASPVAVISYAAWESLFGKRSDIIGSTLVVDDARVTIAGVAPRSFSGLTMLNPVKVWLPLSSRPQLVSPARRELTRDDENFGAAARLNAGVTLDAASAATRVVASRIAASRKAAGLDRPVDARFDRQASTDVVTLIGANGDPNFQRDVRMMTIAFTVLGMLVLLITCTNVSALLAGLGIARRKEVAIRLSMGAARVRVVRQMLTESMLLASLAGPAALAIVWGLQRAVTAFVPEIPVVISISTPAMLFTFGVGLLVGMLFGLSPAMHATRVSIGSVLKESASTISGGHARLQRGLVVAQIAFTQPLVVGVIGLLMALAGAYQRQGLQHNPDRVVALRIILDDGATPGVAAAFPEQGLKQAIADRAGEKQRLLSRLKGMPSVENAIEDPGGRFVVDGIVVHPSDRVAGGSAEPIKLAARTVSPDFFSIMGVRFVGGRTFAESDSSWMRIAPGASAADKQRALRTETPLIIGDDLARRLWPAANPIGRRLQWGSGGDVRQTFVVTGIVDETEDEQRLIGDGHRVYLPPERTMNTPASPVAELLVLTNGPAASLLPAIRRAAREELPRATTMEAHTIAELRAETRRAFHLVAMALSAGGALALLIAAIGLYAVVALSVGQRTGEIAVRMAIGARTMNIVNRFLGEGLRLSAFGLAIGLPLSLFALWFAMSQPDFLPRLDLAQVALIAGVGVFAVATAAALVPARRAAAVDPALVLRGE